MSRHTYILCFAHIPYLSTLLCLLAPSHPPVTLVAEVLRWGAWVHITGSPHPLILYKISSHNIFLETNPQVTIQFSKESPIHVVTDCCVSWSLLPLEPRVSGSSEDEKLLRESGRLIWRLHRDSRSKEMRLFPQEYKSKGNNSETYHRVLSTKAWLSSHRSDDCLLISAAAADVSEGEQDTAPQDAQKQPAPGALPERSSSEKAGAAGCGEAGGPSSPHTGRVSEGRGQSVVGPRGLDTAWQGGRGCSSRSGVAEDHKGEVRAGCP